MQNDSLAAFSQSATEIQAMPINAVMSSRMLSSALSKVSLLLNLCANNACQQQRAGNVPAISFRVG